MDQTVQMTDDQMIPEQPTKTLKNNQLTLLCRVVDNYGDIGVVFRLAKALSRLLPDEGAGLRIIVDELSPFAQISPGLNVDEAVQTHRGWTVCRWNAAEEGRRLYEEEPPLVIVECFACGRPDWLDNILFDRQLQQQRNRDVQIINLEYLTAEPYADEFHKLMSLTRSAHVKKVNFMPGFTPLTGGLILDGVAAAREKAGDAFKAVIFSYERDFSPITEGFARWQQQQDQYPHRPIEFLSAAGKSAEPFRTAFSQTFGTETTPRSEEETPATPDCTGRPELTQLDFLSQEQWDATLYNADFLFIRGEDSLSRACLSGLPFMWHAYPQSEMYHLVKVQALLDRLEPFFQPEDYILLRDYWLWYNGKETAGFHSSAALAEMLMRYDSYKAGFGAFSKMLIKNGNLAEHLMTFIMEIV